MIPTVIGVGLVIGLIPRFLLQYKAVVAVIVAMAWAAYVAFGVDGSTTSVMLGFVLALANTAIGIAIGIGVAALARLRRSNRPRPAN